MNVRCLDGTRLEFYLTPAINNPKATPNCPTPATPKLVSAGCQRLPGGFTFDIPSNRTTAMMSKMEMIPNIEAYESTERGRNTEGSRLSSKKYEF